MSIRQLTNPQVGDALANITVGTLSANILNVQDINITELIIEDATIVNLNSDVANLEEVESINVVTETIEATTGVINTLTTQITTSEVVKTDLIETITPLNSMFNTDLEGRNMYGQSDIIGYPYSYQPFLPQVNTIWNIAAPSGLAPAISSIGMGLSTVSGTAVTNGVFSNTNAATRSKRVRLQTNAALNSSCSTRSSALAFSGISTGLYYSFRFSVGLSNATLRYFAGINSPTGVYAGEPSAQTQVLGLCLDSTDTQLSFLSNGGATANKYPINSGLFPPRTVDILYQFSCYIPSSGSSAILTLKNINTGSAFNQTITTNLPTSSLAHIINFNNGTIATAVAVDFVSFYSESP